MPDSPVAPAPGAVGPVLPLWVGLPLALGIGILIGLGQPPYDLWYLACAGYVLAIRLFLARPSRAAAASLGWALGLGYFGFSMTWIVEPFMVDAAATGWMAPFGLIGLAGGLALFWGLAFRIAAQARYPLVALVVIWSLAELARAYVLTGFPWALVPYFWLPVAVIQWAAVIGPHGLTLLTLAVAACFARALAREGARGLFALAGAAGLGLLFGGGHLLTPVPQDTEGRPVVRLIQPNAAQHEKWDPDKIPIFLERKLTYTRAAAEGPAPDLIVWPETSVPSLLRNAGPLLSRVAEAAGPAQVVVGLQRADEGGYYNSLVVLARDGSVRSLYDKHHLVPFGEYMPAAAFFARWNIAGLAARAEGGYSAGPGPQVIDLGPLGSALPLICYEAVFPQDVNGAPSRPDMLIQITNDAWFGSWSGPFQHLAQARIRAIEQGLPMLRTANTGVSAVIDGAGRVIADLPLGEAGYLDAPLPAPLRVTLYSRTGDGPVLILLILMVVGALFAPRRAGGADSD